MGGAAVVVVEETRAQIFPQALDPSGAAPKLPLACTIAGRPFRDHSDRELEAGNP
jgi:hypothetical protein